MSTKPPAEHYPEVQAEGAEELPIRRYLAVIRKRIWTVIFVFSLVVGAAVLYLVNQADIYEAMVKIEIRTEAPQILGPDMEPVVDPASGARYWSTREYYETQYQVIRSRAVAEEVVTALQLADNLEFLGIDEDLPPDALRVALERADPIDRLIAMTRVEPVPDSQLVRVIVEHSNPELAMQLANALAEIYVERNAAQQQRGTDEAFHWLEGERESLRQRVESAEDALLEFRSANDLHSASLSSRQEQLTRLLDNVNVRLVDAQANLSSIRTERRRIRRARENGEDPTLVPVSAVIDNPLIQSLKEEREALRNELARLRARYLERHPDVEAVTAALEQVDEAIQREIDNVLASIEVDLARAEAVEDDLLELRDSIDAEMMALSHAEPAYNGLVRDIELNAEVLSLIERRYKEADLYRRQQDVNNIDILDAAILPESPVRPRRRRGVALAMVLGLVLGVGFAFVLEMLDNTVRTQEDIERVLGFTFLGVVPSIKQVGGRRDEAPASPDLFIHRRPKSTVAECCRSIRTNLHFMSPDKPLRQVLVTSAGPREGKTSTAINLATVMAQSNDRVLLVDTDMRRPRIHKAFDVDNRVGLTSLILGEVDYDTCIQRTSVPNLDVLSCGPVPPNPTELMHTERFRAIVADLVARYDRVIFDSPPVIAVADAMILANVVDGVLFVIKSGQTSREVVRRAKEMLEGINAPLLGAVLNDLDLEDRAYRYHYYYSYYYRYGQYYDDGHSDDARPDRDEREREAKEGEPRPDYS